MEMEMETEETGKSISDYLQIIKRRKKIIIIPMLILFIISCIFTLALPPLYRSQAFIFIEQQSIPLDMVKSTVVSLADQRIRQIQNNLTSINNLSKIIKEFNLYPRQRKKWSMTDLVYKFRESIHIDIGNEDVIIKGRRSKATLSFTVAFEHKNPIIAQRIAHRLMNFFLEKDKTARAEKAKNITIFLDEEADKFITQIKKMESVIAKYKEENSRSLPELLAVNLGSITRIEASLSQLESQEKLLIEKNSLSQSQLQITSPVLLLPETGPVIETFPELQERYNLLLSKYSKAHPDVKSLKRLVDNFQPLKEDKQIGTNINNPMYIQLKNDIKFAAISLKSIHQQRLGLNEKLKKTEIYIAKTPQIERKYLDLMRNLENNKAKYQDLKSKALEAKLSQTLEEEQKAEKFLVIDPPIVPSAPQKPNRLQIALMGFIISIGGGLALGLFIEIIDGSIRGDKSLVAITGVDPLVIIPYINNQSDLNKSKKEKRIIIMTIISSIFILIAIIAVHKFYKPLYIIGDTLLLTLGSLRN